MLEMAGACCNSRVQMRAAAQIIAKRLQKKEGNGKGDERLVVALWNRLQNRTEKLPNVTSESY